MEEDEDSNSERHWKNDYPDDSENDVCYLNSVCSRLVGNDEEVQAF